MGKKNEGGEVDQQLVRALGHPLRVEILRLLEEGPSGPKRLADRMGGQVSNVSYHTRVLQDCGCIDLLETIPARGAVEHIYKLKPQGAIGSGNWKDLPPALRTHYAGSALAGFASRAVEALEAGTLESREGSGVTWLPLNVDEQGWTEMRGVLGNVEKRFRAVADKSAERLDTAGDGIPVIVAVAAFELASGKDVEPS
ncbi:MAG TPA: winged helix-turn-helix domain-containing protein [Solirubrobacterales bacterium]|nr:winged helix-turn-helix domain-containing protein [Solirubrobacterales bacterium]